MLTWAMTFLVAALTAAAVSYTGPTEIISAFARMVFLVAIIMAGIAFLATAITSLRNGTPLRENA